MGIRNSNREYKAAKKTFETRGTLGDSFRGTMRVIQQKQHADTKVGTCTRGWAVCYYRCTTVFWCSASYLFARVRVRPTTERALACCPPSWNKKMRDEVVREKGNGKLFHVVSLVSVGWNCCICVVRLANKSGIFFNRDALKLYLISFILNSLI